MKTSKMSGIAGVAVAGGAVVLAFQRRKSRVPGFGRGVKIKKAVTVNRPAEELYRHWRNLESLPMLIKHLDSVSVDDATHSCWTVRLPGGITFSWRAEITVDRENEMIGWRSKRDARIETAGYVKFEPGRHGTVVRVALEYSLPAGKLG